MDYDYNRAAFRTVWKGSGVHPLALVYCGCVLFELSLKQHLHLCATSGNGGHDLPNLLQQVFFADPLDKGTLNSLQIQLSDALANLHSQNRHGIEQAVPARNYPYMRYVRHMSDWPTDSSTDSDVDDVAYVLMQIEDHLKQHAGFIL